MTFIARQPEGQPTGGQFAKTAHSDQVPSLGGIPVAPVDPAVDPTHPWRPYAITQDEDGELHYDDVTADWAMQHKEPVTRTEIRCALSCPRLTGRQGRVMDMSNPPGRRFSESDDDYDVVGPSSGAPLVIRTQDGIHRLHIHSGHVQVEVLGGFGGGVTVCGGAEAGIIVDGANKYSVDIERTSRARIVLSEEARVNVRAKRHRRRGELQRHRRSPRDHPPGRTRRASAPRPPSRQRQGRPGMSPRTQARQPEGTLEADQVHCLRRVLATPARVPVNGGHP